MDGVDFSPYLTFVCTTPRYQETLSRYTATDAIHLVLEAQTVVREESGDREREKPRQQVERFPVLEGLRKYAATHHVLLSGKPGSGKSTTLKRLLWEMAEAAQEDEGQPIPVLIQLKSDRAILTSIQDEFEKGDLDWEVNEKDIKRLLRKKRLFLLLDGVNEIPSDELRRQLQQFREDNPHTPMIFTTRDLAVGGDLGIEKKLEMRPLTDTQMREFVGKYLPEYGEVLLRQLQDRLREVAETPLLLKMLCDVFDPQTQQIPKSKGELFRAFNQKYEEHKQYPAVSGDFRRFQSEVLQHLAFEMVQGDREKPIEAWLTVPRSKAEEILEAWLGKRGVVDAATKAKEWLEDLLEHHLLQVAADPRQIEFHHQLFQEYYAAEALLARVENENQHLDVMDDERLQHFFLNYLKWTEPVALMLALLKDEARAVGVVRLAFDVDLKLGARLAGEVKPEFQGKTVNLVESVKVPKRWKFWFVNRERLVRIPEWLPEWLRVVRIPEWLRVELLKITRSDAAIPGLVQALEDESFHVPKSAAEALGEIGSEKAIPGLLKTLEHKSFNESFFAPKREAAEALGKIGSEKAIPGLLQVLAYRNSDVRSSAAEALGKIDSTEIPKLLQALERENSVVRSSAARALGEIGSEKAIDGLLQALEDEDSFVGKSAAEALGKIGSKQAIDGLLQVLAYRNSDVRWSAAEALGEIGSEKAINGLLQSLKDEDSYIRWFAAEALGKIGSEKAIDGLLKALDDEDSDVRKNAIEALGKIGSPKAIPGLLQAWVNRNSDVRSNAAEALGKIDSEAIPGLLQALEDEDSSVRESAAKALGELGSPEVIPGLLQALELQALERKNFWVRVSAVEALEELGSEAIPKLLQALEDEDFNVRLFAALVLGKLGSEAIPGLLQALRNEFFLVRQFAVKALGELGSPEAIPGLLQALKNEDSSVRESAAKALGELGSKQAIDGLLQALKDKDSDVSESAAEALGKIGSEKAIDGLLQALKDKDSDVRRNAVEALGKIGLEAIPRLLQALAYRNSKVRRSGVVANTNNLLKTIQALEDEGSYVPSSAAWALGKIGSPEAIDGLLKALEDEDSSMHRSAIEALGQIKQIKQDKAADILSTLLALIPTYSGEDALRAISGIQQNCQFYNYEISRKQLPPVHSSQPSGVTRIYNIKIVIYNIKTLTYNIKSKIVQIIEKSYGTVIGEQNIKRTKD